MSAPVDVLAVLAEAQPYIDVRAGFAAGKRFGEARDAVAELIEAAAEVRSAHRELPAADADPDIRQAGVGRIGKAHYALEAALARVRGDA